MYIMKKIKIKKVNYVVTVDVYPNENIDDICQDIANSLEFCQCNGSVKFDRVVEETEEYIAENTDNDDLIVH